LLFLKVCVLHPCAAESLSLIPENQCSNEFLSFSPLTPSHIPILLGIGWAKGCACCGCPEVAQISADWSEQKPCREGAAALLPSGMLTGDSPQPNHQFFIEFISRYLSLRPLTCCWMGPKQASGFPSYPCLLPSWGFKSLGATGIGNLLLCLPLKRSSERDGERERGLWAAAQAVRGPGGRSVGYGGVCGW